MTGLEIQALLAEKLANADYETANGGAGSVAKCLAFIAATNKLLSVVPQKSEHGAGGQANATEFDLAAWEKQLQTARQWRAEYGAASNPALSRGRFLGVGSWR